MKNLVLRKVLISLLFGGIASVILIYLVGKYLWKDMDIAQLPLIPMFLSQTFFFSVVFLAASLFPKYRKENFYKGHQLKAIEKAGLALQALSIFFVLSVFFLPFLARFFLPAIVILLGIGILSYYQTKSSLSISFIFWAIGVPLLIYVLSGGISYWGQG